MAKFFGEIGYATSSVESVPGVWIEQITEVAYYGDVVRNSRRVQDTTTINDDITVQNSISIVADAYANENFMAIRYIRWMGGLWTVTEVQQQIPRLLLRLGGVYNGPKAA